MKKNILKSTLVVAALAIAGYGGAKAYSTYANPMSCALFAQNVEALSTPTEYSEQWDCWSELGTKGGGVWRCGVPCVGSS